MASPAAPRGSRTASFGDLAAWEVEPPMTSDNVVLALRPCLGVVGGCC